ncbi:hypothetical protein BAPA111461_23015 [Bacillus paramycoides]
MTISVSDVLQLFAQEIQNFLSFSDRRLLPQKCEGVKHQF